MDNRYELPLLVGETVRYNTLGAGSGSSGVIVQHVHADYVRVLWDDAKVPTTHRRYSLTRALDPGARSRS